MQIIYAKKWIPDRETFRNRNVYFSSDHYLLINRHPTADSILETNFNSPMMGRITHLSISIARGGSTSRCIHIDDTCLITLGWKPTSSPSFDYRFRFRVGVKSFDTQTELAPPRGQCRFDKWQTFRGHALWLLTRRDKYSRDSLSLSLSVEKLASTENENEVFTFSSFDIVSLHEEVGRRGVLRR